jgi:hypothetical protein
MESRRDDPESGKEVAMKVVWVWILLLTLTGCAARSSRQVAQVMNSLVGQKVSEAIDVWGPPS